MAKNIILTAAVLALTALWATAHASPPGGPPPNSAADTAGRGADAAPKAPPLGNVVIDSIVVYKSERRMAVYSSGMLQKTYRVALSKHSVGPKEIQGDQKTPEGLYFINGRNPNSRYYKNLGVSYPNKDDIARARRLGESAGGDIKIHGMGPRVSFERHQTDWTIGCIAVTDEEIDELYTTVKTGARIMILP